MVNLHQRRRESLGEPGCFASVRFTTFHDSFAHQLLSKGILRLRWTELNGQPLSVEYGFRGDDTAYYYQGGFNPEAADHNPGWLQFMSSIRAAIEQGCRHYDFLRGDEPYKALWNATTVPLCEVSVVATHPAAQLRHAVRGVSSAARAVLSRGERPRLLQQHRPSRHRLRSRPPSSKPKRRRPPPKIDSRWPEMPASPGIPTAGVISPSPAGLTARSSELRVTAR